MNDSRRASLRGLGLRACASLCFLILPACQGLHDRLHDAGQIFDVSLTVGPGMSGNIRLTDAVQLGAGAVDGKAYGWVDGRGVAVREQRSEFGASLLHIYEYRRNGHRHVLDIRHPRWGDPGFREYPLSFQQLTDRRSTDVGFHFHLAWLGLNFAFRPDELVDFVAGLFGADPLDDDAHSRSLDELIEQAHSLNARERAAAFDALLRRGEDLHGYAIYTSRDVRPRFQRDAIEAISKN